MLNERKNDKFREFLFFLTFFKNKPLKTELNEENNEKSSAILKDISFLFLYFN